MSIANSMQDSIILKIGHPAIMDGDTMKIREYTA